MPLVMTSGNVSDEPIAYRDEDALERLGRSPTSSCCTTARSRRARTTRCALGVASAGRRRPLLLRRSRGYVPESVELPVAAAAPVLACGAELKSTFCLAKGGRAWVGHHIGDLENYETLRSFREGIAHFERLFAVEPRGRRARPPPGVPVDEVRARARGGRARRRPAPPRPPRRLPRRARRDGRRRSGRSTTARATARTGRSGEASCWWATCRIRARRPPGPVRMPGGEQAIREPWRMACAWLVEARRAAGGAGRARRARRAGAGAGGELARERRGVAADDQHGPAVRRSRGALRAAHRASTTRARRRSSSRRPPTGRARRLSRCRPTARCSTRARRCCARAARPRAGRAGRDGRRPLPQRARARHGERLRRGGRAPRSRCRSCCRAASSRTGCCSSAPRRARRRGLRVLVPERLPPNDGGISFGQAAVAAAHASAFERRRKGSFAKASR